MTDRQPPTNFITPSSIDNLSIAGLSVWLICLTIASLNSTLESFWIRIIAFCISFVWSLSLFFKNKKWNRIQNYILILVNAVFIYVNAAGINTVTRQSPFEGYGVKSDLQEVKSPVVKASLLKLENQKNWYPDYEILRYIDTLKQSLAVGSFRISQLENEFSYIRDNIDHITKDETAKKNIKAFLKDFGKSNFDSSDFAIMKNDLLARIDSLKEVIKYKDEHPITQTARTYYTINGKQISAEELVTQNYIKIGDLEIKNRNLKYIVDLLRRDQKPPPEIIDTLLRKIGY